MNLDNMMTVYAALKDTEERVLSAHKEISSIDWDVVHLDTGFEHRILIVRQRLEDMLQSIKNLIHDQELFQWVGD